MAVSFIYRYLNLGSVDTWATSFVLWNLPCIVGCWTVVLVFWIPLYLSSDARNNCMHCQCSLLRTTQSMLPILEVCILVACENNL